MQNSVLFLCIPLLACRSDSSGTAEVATKTVTSWSNTLDGSGLFEIGAPSYDQCGLFDALNDNKHAPNESVAASPEAHKLIDPVCIDISRLCPASLP